jgi:protein-tyrosine-phosphatase
MHHLRVLETSGVVRRVVSEGDRRRSYVQVVVGAIDAAQAPRPVWEATRILFVCTRNSARSVLAAALWAQASDVPATSAGTDPAPEVHPMAVRAARRHNVGRTPPLDDVVSLARPSHVRDVAQPGDLVVSTCDTAREALVSGAPPSLHWSVADPVRVGTDAAFDVAIRDLSWRVTRLAAVVTPPVT